jgi:hypothetical protein
MVMAKFIIDPHMRLQEWVAEAKVFEEGLKGRKSYEESVASYSLPL